MPEYLLILVIFVSVGLFIQLKYKLKIYENKIQAIHVMLTMFLFGLAWDYFATYRHHWIFPGNGLIGIRIFGLPIEEFLFFLIAPYIALVVFKYHEQEDKK
ncbi:MAG: lycopene cyclase domain-containing protein [bacterium]